MRYLSLLFPLALAACATTGSNGGSILVETVAQGQALNGASCSVSTNGGSWSVTTPASVAIGGANGDLRVICNKPGYRTSELILKPSSYANPSMGVGIGGGSGNVGVGLGFSLPIASGGASYPGRITVNMNPQ
jgi:hypothetical protein